MNKLKTKFLGILLTVFIITGVCMEPLNARGGFYFGIGSYPRYGYFAPWHAYGWSPLRVKLHGDINSLAEYANKNRKAINMQGETLEDAIKLSRDMARKIEDLQEEIRRLKRRLDKR